jgi:hypothetical protein
VSEQDVAAIALEARFWKHAGAKEDAIRTELGTTPTRHFQRIARLLDMPEALAHDPVTVGRLRRVRDRGRQRRLATPSATPLV